MMYSEDQLLPIAALADIVFCPRRAALHQIEQLWTENVATMEGHHLHDKVHDGANEMREGVRMTRGLRIRSLTLGISGIADMVEFHPDEAGIALAGVRGLWRAFPVEYKRGVQRHEEAFEVQLCAQAMCLEEMHGGTVPEGALFYGLSKRRYPVCFNEALRSQTVCAVEALHRLVQNGLTPFAQYEKKCERCSLLSLCMPKTTGGQASATGYLTKMLRQSSAICNP